MVREIIWSDLAVQTYINNIRFLEQHWTEKEVTKFITATERKLEILKTQPLIGRLTNKRKQYRRTIITKPVVLIYRFSARKKQVELLRFFNMRENPTHLPD